MKAVAIESFGGREVLQVMDLPVPDPASGEILIRIKSASVNPVDWKIRAGHLQERLPHEFPIILGWDAAGVVADCGKGVTRFKKGQAVYAYCRKALVKDGTYAEYVAVNENAAALKPESLDFDEAACVPLAGLTAYQCIHQAARLKADEKILVLAAAGGVGTFAVQLALVRGAVVLGTASKRNHQYLLDLGVQHTIDYTSTDVRESVYALYKDGIDVVLDCVGDAEAERSREVLKRGGRFVSILRPDLAPAFEGSGLEFKYIFVEPSGEQLTTLASLIDNGDLKVKVAARIPFQEAVKAHEMIESGRTVGKIALTVNGPK